MEKEEKKLKPVVNPENVKVKQQSNVKKAARSFLAEDINTVKRYLVDEVIKPALRDTLIDAICNGAEMLIGGSKNRRSRRRPGSTTSYDRYYESERRERPRPRMRDEMFDEDDITLGTRAEAEQVLDAMCDAIDRYDSVSVADMYDLLGLTCHNYMANSWGWFDLSSASVSRTSEGYMLKLPRAKSLK